LVWVFWPTLEQLATTWHSDPTYSHGWLVPLFSAYLLWSRRGRAEFAGWQTSWWGVLLLIGGGLVHLGGAYLCFDWLDAIALLPCLAGIAVLLGGRAALSWSWPAIAFLAFMVPLPYQVAHGMAHSLQSLTAQLSGLTLQTLGLPALVEGNTILLEDNRINVIEACSGLSMLYIFIALATAAAIVVRRPLLDRAILVLSAIPIAILANTIRIAATGLAMVAISPQFANKIFHDWAGWLMIPLAVAMLMLVLKLIDILLIPDLRRHVRPYRTASKPSEKGAAAQTPASHNGKRGQPAATVHRFGH
jgi:exosortase